MACRLVFLFLLPTLPAKVGDVAIVDARARTRARRCPDLRRHLAPRRQRLGPLRGRVARAWRVRGPDDTVLGTRALFHPHETEQPFTRSLSGMRIQPGTGEVQIEAHDKVHGWATDRLTVALPGR